MDGDTADHEPDPGDLQRRRHLSEHEDADPGCGRGQERPSLAIASWSHTYGIKEEAIPTPTPAASATGSVSAGSAAQPASGVATASATSIDAARPSMPLTCSP